MIQKGLALPGEQSVSVPHNLTVTALAKVLPCSWAEQERRVGLASSRA
jgi:hypothetical protein